MTARPHGSFSSTSHSLQPSRVPAASERLAPSSKKSQRGGRGRGKRTGATPPPHVVGFSLHPRRALVPPACAGLSRVAAPVETETMAGHLGGCAFLPARHRPRSPVHPASADGGTGQRQKGKWACSDYRLTEDCLLVPPILLLAKSGWLPSCRSEAGVTNSVRPTLELVWLVRLWAGRVR